MNIFHAKFSTGQIIEATRVSNDTLQNWLKRKLIIGQNDIEGGGSQGRHRQFSFHNLIEIATAKALIDTGMGDLKSVFYAAGFFAHTGDTRRVPGCPFNRAGITLLVAGSGSARDVLLSPDDTGVGLYAKIAAQHSVGAVILNMSAVFDQTVTRAGYHPEAVMAHAYEGVTA